MHENEKQTNVHDSQFCNCLRSAVRKIARHASQKQDERKSLVVLGNQPINLDLIGCGWVNDLIYQLVLRPISRLLFEIELDFRHGYVAGYSSKVSSEVATTRDHLVSHTDDSEVTINVCLGDDSFEGGNVRFYGLREISQERKPMIGEYEPKPGIAIVHAGRHLHEVTKVTEGDRYAYIIWARSWNQVRAISCPCCWLNNRTQKDPCICSPRWN